MPNPPTLRIRMDKLEAKVEELTTTLHGLVEDMGYLKTQVERARRPTPPAVVAATPVIHCAKCTRIVRTAGGRCLVCGHQN